MRAGRPLKLDAKEQQRFARLWKRKATVETMCFAFQLSQGSVFRYVHRLGLSFRRKVLEERRYVGAPLPVAYRCPHCRGRSDDPNGHPACQARAAA